MAKNATRARSSRAASTPEEKRPTALRPDAPPEPLAPEADWTRRHLLDLDDFTSTEIELVLDTTDAMKEVLGRDVPRVPALRGTTIVTLFYEASTRTRASFELAGKVLGADVINVAASSSSAASGTVRNLASPSALADGLSTIARFLAYPEKPIDL